jgi:hypothetical protein
MLLDIKVNQNGKVNENVLQKCLLIVGITKGTICEINL